MCKKPEFERITDFHIKTDYRQVLTFMECTESDPMYDKLRVLCGTMEEQLQSLVQPEAVVVFDTFPEPEQEAIRAEAAYVLYHPGGRLSDAVSEAFARDSYMEAMLLDAMGDDYLFQMGDQLMGQIQALAAGRGYGIRQRLEAPSDIPAHTQKTILDKIKEATDIDVDITDGYMFRPVKTLAFVLLLTEDLNQSTTFHNCKSCEKTDCSRRKKPVTVEVLWKGKAYEINNPEPCHAPDLYQLLQQHKFPVPGPCGGNGSCGKCRIRVDYGYLEITPEDLEVFSEEELAAGWRLACRAYPDRNCTIELCETSEAVQAVSAEHTEKPKADTGAVMGIAVDIGTTTLAFALADAAGHVVGTHVAMNSQKRYGADVITRQLASGKGHAGELRTCITDDLLEGLAILRRKYNVSEEQMDYMVIACNMTMTYLLMGYSCEGLGSYPYHVEHPGRIDKMLPEVLGAGPDIPLTILPGISAYVGGDVVAGLLACGYDKSDRPFLLLDIGTNGEMAVGMKDHILVTSAAAGPAFEGGNISCGMAGVSGAVSGVRIVDGVAETEVIGGGTPQGICGTGVLECVAELLRHGIIDESGLLKEPYFTEGFCFGETADGSRLTLTQKDIREFQMAKGAIRAGMEVLLDAAGISFKDLERVDLAGGFGVYMDVKKAVQTGLLPPEAADKVAAAGNTSLAGARLVLRDPGTMGRMKRLTGMAQEIHLSEEEAFQELYMKHMYLGSGI